MGDSKNVSNSYDNIADEYASHLFDELKDKPLDRELLARFAAATRETGTVCDLGCGPGHVARHLRGLGSEVIGLDISPGMVAKAKHLNPGIEFRQGDMLDLDVADGSWSGIVAFYSIIHVPRKQLPRAFAEMHRALTPGGLLLVSLHIGEEIRHLDEMWDRPVSLDFHFFETEDVKELLRGAGFEIEDEIERDPYPEPVEVQTRRAYIFAKSDGKTKARPIGRAGSSGGRI